MEPSVIPSDYGTFSLRMPRKSEFALFFFTIWEHNDEEHLRSSLIEYKLYHSDYMSTTRRSIQFQDLNMGSPRIVRYVSVVHPFP
jgi:hypothetical protein